MVAPSRRASMPTEPSRVDDVDDISLISTEDEDDDSDKEWVVDDIYAERDHPDVPGEKQYLIKWDGFPMDQCTWEPTENLGPGLLSQWTETKEEIAAGKRQPFDIEIYNAARKARDERHMRRNAIRKRRGLSLTRPFPSRSPTLESPTEVEAQEKDDAKPTRPTPKKKSQKVPKQKSPSGKPSEKPEAGPGKVQNVNQKIPARAPPPPPPSSSAPQQPGVSKRRTSSGGTSGATASGYQGTARKPSTSMNSGAPADKAPSSTLKPSPTLPPKPQTSLANKFAGKQLRATRTRPQPAASSTARRTSNVFVGGKEPKKRASLGDIMGDPSKAPKSFSSMRVMNIAKKRGIEKNNAAVPDLSSIPASFLLTKDQKNRPKVDQTKSKDPSTAPTPPSIVQSPTAMSPGDTSTVAPAPKAKKSVRFTGAEDISPRDEPMSEAVNDVVDHIASGLDSGNDPPGDPVSATAPPTAPKGPRRLSLARYQERTQTQVVAKATVFGKAGSESLKVLFCGISRQTQPWLSAFMARETLDFSTVCASYNFISHRSGLVGEILSAGAIDARSPETLSALTNVAEHLRHSFYGSHLVTEQFSILVYPSNCDSWNELGIEIDTDDSRSLRHIIYKSPLDMRLHAPESIPRAPVRLSHTGQGSHCRVLIEDLFALDFSRFLPQEPKMKDKQVFMLLFPEREMQLCNMIKLWLRSCQPNCRIFSHEINDSWVKFHETVRAGAAGTLILHEDVSAVIRKVPRIYQMIDYKRCYTFWDLATGQYDPPRFPSDIHATIEPGTLQMTRLFPYGRAFLITPSFALSDPARLCQFLDLFKRYCVNPHYLIVACADFPNYLKAITLEKEREREAMCSLYKGKPNLEELLTDSGLGKADLEARFRAWEILQEIMGQFGDEDTSEEIRKVEWVTNFIDPNDEQSLVNWFCWWSTLKCDRYRKFTVLGSSNNRIKAAYRHIEIPTYTDETVGDPDIALAREDERRRARETAEGAKEIGQGVSAASVSAPNTPVSRQSPDFRRAVDLRNWITDLYGRSRTASWARLHVNPVSWLNVPMADHFGDPRCEFDTFKNWFGNTPRFTTRMNTWYGLFYTIDKEWNPHAPTDSYGRHPWIVVFRPIDPHFADRYKRMELFIWDFYARDRESTRGHSSLLLDMQRRLVDFVREETPQREQYYLDEVYISSKTRLNIKPTDHPVDITCRRLEEMITDGKVWLPPFENLLPDRGWVALPKSEWKGGMAVDVSDLPQKAQRGRPSLRHHSDSHKLQRSIWHPPRPMGKEVGKSKCVNHLYEAARGVRAANESSQTMRYQYRSTLDWYHDIRAEGRGAGHVHVESADKILYRLFQKK
ncbi:hypothetical protein F4677DRAFT_402843 [Hypoxylon crocopeplum]|nr:hypothetical protein F4677DRAFT_402843 [Hypoxylon crocopeplum]